MLTRRSFLAAIPALALGGCGPSDWLLGAAAGHAQDGDPAAENGITLARHVLNRCTFGPRAGDLGVITRQGVAAWIDDQLAPVDEGALDRLLDDLTVLHAPAGEAYEYKPRFVQDEVIRGTLLRAVYARGQLREVVAACWRDQFNVGAGKGDVAWLVASYDREVIRAHALGRYRDLLRASLTHPAMLWYLDGRTSQREHPNENHARELLELHGLGAGTGYTQADVQEVARALTGWSVRPASGFAKAEVEFHADRHDAGSKRILGAAIPPGLGQDEVERIVDLVAAHPATAWRIAHRLCARFIADVPPEAAVAAATAAFTASGGDLAATVRAVLTHPAFADPAIRGQKLKRPFHWLASGIRLLDLQTTSREVVDALQRLGEAPYQHPTPEGYPEGAAHWTGTLWWRWRIALELARRSDRILDPALVCGRLPTAQEQAALATSDPLHHRALALALPAFLRC